MLTGLKDLDREILSKMDDRELLTVCQIDKRFYNEVCDDNFLRRRLLKYPGIEKYKRENETWKQFFLSVIFNIAKMKEDYNFTYTFGNFRKIYSILQNYKAKNLVLQEAAKFGELDLVKYALNNGAEIHSTDDFALRYASQNGHLQIVRYLVENGANINANNNGALNLAIMNGKLEVIKYLVDHGAVINDRIIKNAEIWEYPEIVEYLSKKLKSQIL